MNRLRFYYNNKWINGFFLCDSSMGDDLIWVEDEEENTYLINKEDTQPVMQELTARLRSTDTVL
jgi:hypothetical protein